jgi:hypothetical protein
MTGNVMWKMKFDVENEDMAANFSNTPIIISNDKFMLVEEIVKQVSTMSVGDIVSVTLVEKPDAEALQRIKYEKDATAMEGPFFDFDD